MDPSQLANNANPDEKVVLFKLPSTYMHTSQHMLPPNDTPNNWESAYLNKGKYEALSEYKIPME